VVVLPDDTLPALKHKIINVCITLTRGAFVRSHPGTFSDVSNI
jgi:hypothetical protein